MNLNDIGQRHGTDKSSDQHDYLSFYERFFQGFRNEPVKILEIGVLGGASLKTWEEYFPNGTIIGADIVPASRRFAGGRVSIEILDQSNVDDLFAVGTKHGPFDIIIEDGSHLWEHQITSLRSLFPFLRNGGYYIIEDLQTNFGAMQAGYRGIASFSCVEYLKRAVDLRVADTQLDIAQEEDAFLRTYARSMNLTFYKHSCLIEKTYKKSHSGSLTPSAEPFVDFAGGGTKIPISVIAHFGNFGDASGGEGALKSENSNSQIQGFKLEGPEPLRDQIRYRGRLASGDWTNWAAPGAYVGTQGVYQNLTGFAVRLEGDLQFQATLQTAGAFRDGPGIQTAGSGEDCTRPGQISVLYGMQISLRRNTLG